MFDFVAKNKRLLQVMLALIAIPFAFFGLEAYTRAMRGSGDDVASVDGVPVTQREFSEELRQQQDRVRQIFGRNFDPSALDTPAARGALLESLVSQRLVGREAARANLIVSDERLRDAIAAMPAFQRDGRFDPATYRTLLGAQGMSEAAFEARLRYDLSVAQLTSAIAETGIESQAVAARIAALEEQRREVQESLVPAQQFLGQAKLDEASLKAYYEAHLADFRVPERVRAEYLVLSAEEIGRREPVTEAELKAAYDARASEFRVDEQRRASHILVKTKEEAEKLSAELKKDPQRFPELAKKFSQDTGSAEKGGDLGFFGRGMLVKPFEDAAFAMKEGEVSAPVQSEFGFHVIRLTGIQTGKARTLEEVRKTLAPELAKQKGQRKFAEAAEGFSNLVYEQSDSLKPAAERYKLPVQTSGWLTRAPSPGVLGNAKLLAALFSSDAIQAKRNTDAIEVSSGVLVAARVAEHQPEVQRKLEEVRAQVEERARRAEAASLAQKEGEAQLAKLRKGEEAGVAWGAAKTVARRSPQGLLADVLQAVLSADAARLPAFVGAARGEEGYALYRVVRVLAAETKTAEQLRADQARAERAAGAEQFSAYVAALRARTKVEINRANLERK